MDKKEQAKQKRRTTLLKTYGSEEGLRQHYRDMQKKSRENYNGTGGLLSMTPERRKEISRMGNDKQRREREAKNASQAND